MKNLIFVMLTLCQFIIDYSRCDFPDELQNGCDLNYREKEQHLDRCVNKVYCVNNFDDINIGTISNNLSPEYCNHSMYVNNNYYVPVWLNYRRNIFDDHNNGLENLNNLAYNVYSLFSVLDITFNDYENVPIIGSLPNLEFLNASHNEIMTAKLYNEYDLESLKEIDFSYNKINIIDNYEYENIYLYIRLKKIWLSHNELIELPDMSFKIFSNLKYLDLSHNLIANLTIFTFEGLTQLEILQISNNGIVNLNSSLFRFNELTELYINNNKLKDVLFRDFEMLNKLMILDLSNNFIVNLEKDAFKNLNSLKQLDLSGNHLTAIDKDTFSATHFLDSINLSANELTEIPTYLFRSKTISFFAIEKNNLHGSLKRGTFDGLKLNTKLDISFQSIASIEPFAFFGLDNLKELLLNNNIIRTLSKESFKTLRYLEKIDLSFNQITNIDFDKTDLLSLQSMLFHANHITHIKNDNFDGLELLQSLDLSLNNISKLNSKSFRPLGYINNFVINHNPITGDLEAETFKGLNLVPILDLSCTMLNVIKNVSFDDMINLRYLNISHSKVRELQYNAFWNTGSIEILDLSFNEIKEISLNTSGLKNLNHLLLNNNHIIRLISDIFKGLPLLNKVLLSYNLIKSIDDETFIYQKQLRYLDLSYNSNMKFNLNIIKKVKSIETLILSGSISNTTFIESDDITSLTNLEISHADVRNVSNTGLNKMTKLQSLDLSSNNVTQLDVGAFTGLREICHIDISYNKINAIQPGVFKDNLMLTTFNISHNHLMILSHGVLHDLINLRVLDISYNFISSLEISRFYGVVNLKELIADHNRIADISFEDFRETNLQKLSIGDNPLTCDKVLNIKKASDSSLLVTAVRHVEDKEENIYGITCNTNHQRNSLNFNVSDKTHKDTNNVLTEIRDILLNLNIDKIRNEEGISKNDDNNKFNVTQLLKSSHLDYIAKISELSNATTELNNEQKNTNQLLENILKVAINLFNKTLIAPIKYNITSDNFIDYINQLRQDFKNAMILNNEKIVADVESRILLLRKRIESVNTTKPSELIPKNERMNFNSEPKSSVFVETCVAFILLILVCLVLYKAYKSRFYISRGRSISTRVISDAMDTSNV